MIYNISYKTLIGPKPLRIRFDKIDEFIRFYGESKYLVLLGHEKYYAIYNKTRYFISIEKVALQMFLPTIIQKSKLILMILYL